MLPFAETALAVLLAIGAANTGAPHIPVAADTVTRRDSLSLRFVIPVAQDTIRKPRRKAYEYSSGYLWRNTLHRRLSWAMLPLFALSYASGDQILKKGSLAPSWARSLHRPSATGTATLFTVNAVTGTWNLWEGRHDPNARKKRIAHSVLFMGASAGFVYAGTTLANQAEQSDAKRRQHRNVNLTSIGVATSSWLLMFINR